MVISGAGKENDNARKAHELHLRAFEHFQTGNIDAAIDLLRQALPLDPHNGEIVNNLGKALLAKGLPQEAGPYLEAVANALPGNAEAQTNLAQVYHMLQYPERAEELYKAALAVDEHFMQALGGLGTLMEQKGKPEQAIILLEKYAALAPAEPAVWQQLAGLYEFTGQTDKTASSIINARALPGHDATVLDLLQARLLRRQKKYAEAIALLEPSVSRAADSESAAAVHYQLGRLCDLMDKTDAAFTHFEKANALMAQSFIARHLDRAALPRHIEKCAAVFTKDFVKSWRPAPPADRPAPVFLVGFPRSGTTLLDQILSSHPGITVAEEKPALPELRAHLGDAYPEDLATLDADTLRALRAAYFARHNNPAADRVFIDKLPLNMLDAGLIHRLFPDAKIVLAQRHPFDCVLSCFMQEFALNPAMIHFLTLEDSARFYDQAFSLWEQYRSILPLNVHTVRYEDVVDDFRGTVANVLSFLGLKWNDAVLAYDETAKKKTAINTPSYNQVTEKIYNTARYRWQRYKPHLAPVLPLLTPWARRYGYDAD